ncbi:VOC family protein [Nitriliruptoraceae bacterium ZYF776]|nr:VOC family protein [Profundirhabdus halotolerans]
MRGIFNVKIPVSDLPRSRDWYERVLGFEVELEFPDESGVVRGVAGHLPGVEGTYVSLRENPTSAAGLSGADVLGLSIADRSAAEAWAARFDELGIDHSPVIDATIGWLLVFHDPDGIELHLYSQERHGIDQTGRAGYGRRTIRA